MDAQHSSPAVEEGAVAQPAHSNAAVIQEIIRRIMRRGYTPFTTPSAAAVDG